MRKKKTSEPIITNFSRVYEIEVGNFTIVKGDLIKIQDEHGRKFKFDSIVTNKETGVQWIDCFEVQKMRSGALYSFTIDRLKRIPTRRGKRKKNVI
ncbi:hypothetical protein UFOVP222_66 [uncultured Caudovirales phage]|uniref:DUF7246 domain-containing protein n=1 Tax=uncultured Caudovirales phage TaxID=2100421 RepID=A0A6J7WNQ6_9CAUD|nr:hypothetical protein UFOVP108_61 [uncultured Caudovirales phage]CAB5219410.1 hypothetical protein UFOVP222_66 [uncultured Caudovirales phage]